MPGCVHCLDVARCACEDASDAALGGLLAGIIVPPVPEKNAMSKLQMSMEFIEMRRRTLTSFINRVVRGLAPCALGLARVQHSAVQHLTLTLLGWSWCVSAAACARICD